MYQFATWNEFLNFFTQSSELFRFWILLQKTKELQVSIEMSLFIPFSLVSKFFIKHSYSDFSSWKYS